jgi:hypothetical protein
MIAIVRRDNRGPDEEWSMLQKINLVIVVTLGMGAICGGVWAAATSYVGIQTQLTTIAAEGVARDRKVDDVKKDLNDPNSAVNKMLAEHGTGIADLKKDLGDLRTALGDIKTQLTNFEVSATGHAPKATGSSYERK